MSNPIENEYLPDGVSPPGETLLETIEALGMTQIELADRMGRPRKTINEIIKGKTAITPETALQLEHVVGVPARFWITREQHYREALARTAEQTELAEQREWQAQFPLQEMVEQGWIAPLTDVVDQIRALLDFFGVASPQQWRELWLNPRVAFRQSPVFASAPGALAAWLRRGEIEAQQLVCSPYNATEFRAVLKKIRALTVQPPAVFQPETIRLCAQVGVAVVFVPELAQLRVCGATRWLTPNKALLQLSLRYKTNDQLWFSFFHEAGHLLLHGKRDIFLEGEDGAKLYDATIQRAEAEADAFATDFLIDKLRYRSFVDRHRRFTKELIRHFAQENGIAPGIVVGRLQHDGRLPYAFCNELKERLTWSTSQIEIQ